MSEATKAVFLSYASQDAEAAKKICEALRAVGIEVWFDQNELVGGDAWDAKIRKQIQDCALFVPLISANTQARLEGYFRLEWKLAAQRTHTMADEKTFLLPVVIDTTRDSDAKVPPEFKTVQWTKLPGGETPEKFFQRVKHLLGGSAIDVGPVAPASVALAKEADRAPGHRPGLPQTPAPSRPWLVPVALGGAALIALALWQPWKKAAPGASSSTASAPATLSEARKLVAQARTYFDEGDQSNYENFSLGEDLLKKAVAADSTDGEVWAAQAQLSAALYFYSYDRSAARRETMRQQAERAVKLAPDSFEAQLAMAEYLVLSDVANIPEAIPLLNRLAERRPNDRRAFRTLGVAYSYQGRMDELIAAFERGNATPGGDPEGLGQLSGQLFWHNRFDEMAAVIARARAQRSVGRLLMWDVVLKLSWQGDLDGAVDALNRWPSWVLREDRGAFLASQVWMWRREPDKAIALLNGLTRDFLNDSLFVGPKAGLLALAHEMAHRTDAARGEWENARNVAARIYAEDPSNKRALAWKAMASARLGDTAGADAMLKELEQIGELRADFWSCGAGGALLRIAVGRSEEVAPKFDLGMRISVTRGTVFPSPQAALRLNPVFDPIRGTPAFQKWLAAAPAPKPKTAGVLAPLPADDKSVAVLAFADNSPAHDSEYFSDGIADELLTTLRKIPGLKVAARTSAFSFKGTKATAQEIGRKLGMAFLVEGSVQKAGPRVKITARLSRTTTGEEVWSESYGPLELTDVFATQSEIAQAIVAQVQGQLGGDAAVIQAKVRTAEAGGTTNVEAHQLYLRGSFFYGRQTKDDLLQAADFFQQAVQLDPNYVAAWTFLGGTYSSLAAAGFAPSFDAAVAEAKTATARALALAPESGVAHSLAATLKMNYDFDWLGARREIDRAYALAPEDEWVLQTMAFLAMIEGDAPAALRAAQHATEIDPLNSSAWLAVGRAHYMARNYRECETAARRIVELTPNGPRGLSLLSLALFFQKRYDEMASTVAQIREPNWSKTMQALLRAAVGPRTEADALLMQLETSYASVIAYQIAELHAYRGEKDAAFTWLERAVRERDPGIYQVASDPFLDALHADPRWAPFLETIRVERRQK